MKNLTSLLFIFFSLSLNLSSQTPDQNLQKYWNYRERLRNEYILISPNNEPGTNIPAVSKYFEGYTKDVNENFTSWGDGNPNMSHYLGILATEYRLLKNNVQDYTQTIQELLYAIKALERLDLSAENNSLLLNGFFIRDDVDKNFYDNNIPHFKLPKFHSSLTSDDQKEMSQDNVWNLLEGLALVKVLVDKEYVDGDWYDFKEWVQKITYRIIRQMQHDVPYVKKFDIVDVDFPRWFPADDIDIDIVLSAYWYIKNPSTGQFVLKGAGDEFDNEYLFSYGFAEAGNFIMGSSHLHFQNSSYRSGFLLLLSRYRHLR